jgi:hypothetical protein
MREKNGDGNEIERIHDPASVGLYLCSSVAPVSCAKRKQLNKMITDLKRLNEVTERIIGCAYAVSNGLGVGFLEKVYENALIHELRKAGLNAEQQQPIKVLYDGVIVGDYFADVVVEESVII